jgi:cytochrome c-type biogenesis protein CcmH
MIVFGIVALLLSAAVAAAVLRGAAAGARVSSAENPAVALHRRELAEVDDLSERGLLSEDEYTALRAETARRLLAAAGETAPTLAPASKLDRRLTLVGAALAPVLALGLYILVGAPGYADQPFAKRMAQWRAHTDTLTVPEMGALLTKITKERPKDPDAWRALGIAEMAQGKGVVAQTSFRKAVNLAPQRADLWVALGESLIASSTDQTVGTDAQAAFRQALSLDSNNLQARYYLAKAQMEGGDKAGALAALRQLRDGLPAGDSRRSALDEEISAAEAAPQASGPTAGQVAAAQGQVGPDQIKAMVDRLAQRLKAQPNDPAGWVQLVRAYAVLGDVAKRDAALKTARTGFGSDPEVLKQLDAAAATPRMGAGPQGARQ